MGLAFGPMTQDGIDQVRSTLHSKFRLIFSHVFFNHLTRPFQPNDKPAGPFIGLSVL
jgi:hypothetical protein